MALENLTVANQVAKRQFAPPYTPPRPGFPRSSGLQITIDDPYCRVELIQPTVSGATPATKEIARLDAIPTALYKQCESTDQPSAALVKDLKMRWLLNDTLVIWGGEFGRTPFIQGNIHNRLRWGRDHHPYAFTVWMAGGGVKPGITYGASDELGFNVADDKVYVHDLQATIMHLMGINHEALTYRFQGRYFRLTDVFGHVVHDILAWHGTGAKPR